MSNYYYSGYVRILGRKHGSNENHLNVECSIFDMSAYVDSIRSCLNSKDIDYLIIEPVKITSDLFEQIFYD